jgi:TatA/E family protein of Tat protein translocase
MYKRRDAVFTGHAWIILVVILLIVLIIWGPRKLSQLGGALGNAVRDFRKSQEPDERETNVRRDDSDKKNESSRP